MSHCSCNLTFFVETDLEVVNVSEAKPSFELQSNSFDQQGFYD